MALPWQLEEGLKRRRALIKKGIRPPPRPIVEQLPSVSANELQIPRDSKVYTLPNASLRWPFLANIRMTWDAVELIQRSLHRAGFARSALALTIRAFLFCGISPRGL